MRCWTLAAGALALGFVALGANWLLTKRHEVVIVNATGSSLGDLRLTFGHSAADQIRLEVGPVEHLGVRRVQFAHPGEAGYVFWSRDTIVGQCGYADARRNEVVAVLAPELPGGANCTRRGPQSLLDALY